MAGDYRVYDHKGKSLTGKDGVDRQTAQRVYEQQRGKTRDRTGEKPTMVRKGQDKDLASRE